MRPGGLEAHAAPSFHFSGLYRKEKKKEKRKPFGKREGERRKKMGRARKHSSIIHSWNNYPSTFCRGSQATLRKRQRGEKVAKKEMKRQSSARSVYIVCSST